MKTVLLDQTSWDLVLDVAGNIAVAADPYSQAQDASSAIRTFQGEVFYDTTLGVPYNAILNKAPNLSYIRSKLQDAALTVPGLKSSAVFFSSFNGRQLSGQVRSTNTAGQTSTAGFSV